MAAIIKRCYICDYEYDEEQKRPLMLDCGHSFCQSCLQQIKEGGEATCPTCRRCWEEKNIEELPLCYQLLPEEPEGVTKLCTDHKSQVLFWCETCKYRLCRKCLREKHRRCEWVLLEERLDPMKEDFMQKADVIFTRLTESLDKIGKTTSENKAVLDLIRDLKKVLGPAEVQFAAYQQQILLLRVKVSKEVVTLENLKTNWAIPPGSDFMSKLQSKTKALEEIQKVLWWPQQPNWRFLGRIVDNFQQNRTRELTLEEICDGAALPLSDDESGFDGQNDDNEEEEENEEQQQVEDGEDEEEDGENSARENSAAASAATTMTFNAVQTNDSAGPSGFRFTPEDAARIFSADVRLTMESTAVTSAHESNATSSFSFGTFPQGGILASQESSRLSFGSAPPVTSMLSSETPMTATQRNIPQTSVFTRGRATQALATPNSLFVFRRSLRLSANVDPSSIASSFGSALPPPPTTAPASSTFSIEVAPPPPPTTAPTSSTFSFGAAPPPPPTTAPTSSAFSFGTAPQPPEITAPTSSTFSFGAAPPPPPTTAPTSSAFSFGIAPQPPETTAPTSSTFSFGAAPSPPPTTAPTSSAFLFGTAPQPPKTTAPTSSAFSFGTVPSPPPITAPTSSVFSFGTAPQPPETTAPTSSAFSFGTVLPPQETNTPTSSDFLYGTAPQPPPATASTRSASSFETALQPPETTALSSSTATQLYSTSVSFPVNNVAPVVGTFRFTATGQVPTTDAATTTGALVITASSQTVATAPTTARQGLAATVYTIGSSAGASSIASFPASSATTTETSVTGASVPRTTTATPTQLSVAASTAGFSPAELISLAASGIHTVRLVTSPTPQTTATVDNADPVRDAVPLGSEPPLAFSLAPVIQTSGPTTQLYFQTSQMIPTAVQTTAVAIPTASATTTQNSDFTAGFFASTSIPANPSVTRLVTATGALVATTEGATPSSQMSGSTTSNTGVLTFPTETGLESILPQPMNVVEQVNDTDGNNNGQGRPVTVRNPGVQVSLLPSVVDSDLESVRAVSNVSDHLDLTDAVADALRQLPEKPPSSSMTLASFQFAESIRQEMARTVSGDASASVVDALEQLKKFQKIHTPGRSPTFESSDSGEVFPSYATPNTNTETSIAGAIAAPAIADDASSTKYVRTESIGMTVVPATTRVSRPEMNLLLTQPPFSSSTQLNSARSVLGSTPSVAFAMAVVDQTPGRTVAQRGNSDLEGTTVASVAAPDERAAQEPARDSAMVAAMLAPEVEDCVGDATLIDGLGDMFEAAGNSAVMTTEEATTAVRTSSEATVSGYIVGQCATLTSSDVAAGPGTATTVAEGVTTAGGDASTTDDSMSAASENRTAIFQAGVEAARTTTRGSEAAVGAGGSQGATALSSGFTFGSLGAAASVRPKQPAPQATGGGATTSSLFRATYPNLSLLLETGQSPTTEGDIPHPTEPRVVLRRGGPFLRRPLRMRRKARAKS